MASCILAIDQGTTSSRAVVFDRKLKILGTSQKEFRQHYPRPGWVEHDPEEIWQSVVQTCRSALRKARSKPAAIAAIGITNQRETTVIWNRRTGRPVHRAIVWQDRRTAAFCTALRDKGHEDAVAERTGLLLDPYFSASKIGWILDRIKNGRERAARGELAFGTIDAFLIWRLTGGRVHATDATNASRTMLFDIHRGEWNETLLDLFGIPPALLPAVKDCVADYGVTEPSLFGAPIPIFGVAGDQQAAAIGQACFRPGMVKATFGTGAFILVNTGEHAVRSRKRLLTTIASQFDGRRSFALEGSIFVAGAAVQWLRDGLKIIGRAGDAADLARRSDPAQPVYLVPAFVGLGAPYWDADARGAIFGITRGTGREELARAALESVCYQTRDLLEAMKRDRSTSEMAAVLRVDGGMAASDWTMQFLADIIDAPVERPTVVETTALGAAYLAGLGAGFCAPPETIMRRSRVGRTFKPRMREAERSAKLAGWSGAVARTLTRGLT